MQSREENKIASIGLSNETKFHDSGVGRDYDLQTERTVIKIVTGILALMTVYIMISQVAFFTIASIIKKGRERSNNSRASSLNLLFALASFTTFLRIGLPVDYIIGYDTKVKCIIIIEYRIVTFGLALALLYTILWVRQMAFYLSPALRDLSTPFIRCCRIATPFIIWPGCVITILLVSFAEDYYQTEFGCAIKKKASLNEFAWAFRGVAFFMMQCNLLSLFVYPLIRHRKVMRGTIDRPTDMLDVLIKRASITTVICICMDTITSLMGLLYNRDLAIVHHFIYDINIVVILMAVILSFKNWRDRLFPWYLRRRGNTDDLDTQSNETNRTGTTA